ncbi:hypothetical protein [Prauserella muralis]|nr:hypothetical protein [Prauserella muralis]TWE29899.1 hypothetical protein FHX69_2591 [Prauserella muralis]
MPNADALMSGSRLERLLADVDTWSSPLYGHRVEVVEDIYARANEEG